MESYIKDAEMLLKQYNHLSVPFLQRKLKINYTVANKLFTLLVR